MWADSKWGKIKDIYFLYRHLEKGNFPWGRPYFNAKSDSVTSPSNHGKSGLESVQYFHRSLTFVGPRMGGRTQKLGIGQ